MLNLMIGPTTITVKFKNMWCMGREFIWTAWISWIGCPPSWRSTPSTHWFFLRKYSASNYMARGNKKVGFGLGVDQILL